MSGAPSAFFNLPVLSAFSRLPLGHSSITIQVSSKSGCALSSGPLLLLLLLVLTLLKRRESGSSAVLATAPAPLRWEALSVLIWNVVTCTKKNLACDEKVHHPRCNAQVCRSIAHTVLLELCSQVCMSICTSLYKHRLHVPQLPSSMAVKHKGVHNHHMSAHQVRV